MRNTLEHGGPGRPRTLHRNDIGRRIDELAERRRLSLYDLAKLSGISAPTIHRLATIRKPDPKVSTLVALAEALGVTVDELLPSPRRNSRRSIA